MFYNLNEKNFVYPSFYRKIVALSKYLLILSDIYNDGYYSLNEGDFMSSSISSITSALSSTTTSTSSTSTLAQKLADLKKTTVSSLLSSLDNSSEMASLTETLCGAKEDQCSISSIAVSLNSVADAAEKSGVSDGMEKVKQFTESLQTKGYDTISILTYLSYARNLAKNNPDSFLEVFGSDSTDDTTDTDTDTSDTTSST